MNCPKCGKDIDFLHNHDRVTTHWVFSIRDGRTTYDGGVTVKSYESDCNDYICPECLEVLFTDEESAANFLKGGQGEGKEEEAEEDKAG